MFFKKKNLLQIAIDGTAGSGKSTISKEIAKHYNISYLSTGVIFRCFAFAIQKNNIDCHDEKAIKKIIKKTHLSFINGQFYLNGNEISKEIYSAQTGAIASEISQNLFVRKCYEKITRKIIKNKSFVVEGRDICTNILPKTKYKFYLDASIEERAKRRVLQLKQLGLPLETTAQQDIAKSLKLRDDNDKQRKLAALIVAKDAVVINTDNKKINEIVSLIVDKINKSFKK